MNVNYMSINKWSTPAVYSNEGGRGSRAGGLLVHKITIFFYFKLIIYR